MFCSRRRSLLVGSKGTRSSCVTGRTAPGVEAEARTLSAAAEGPVGAGPGKSGQIWMQASKQDCVHLVDAQRRVQRPHIGVYARVGEHLVDAAEVIDDAHSFLLSLTRVTLNPQIGDDIVNICPLVHHPYGHEAIGHEPEKGCIVAAVWQRPAHE